MVLKKFKETISQYNLLNKSDKVLLAVSGGIDSVCMFYLFTRVYPKDRIICAYINHRLRKESLDEMRFVRSLTKSYGVEILTRSVDVKSFAKKKKYSIEEAGRILRYKTLISLAKRYDCNKVATAHNLNDNVETIMFNLFRGTGLKGLCGIPIKIKRDGVEIIRPMLRISRDEIIGFVKKKKMSYMVDKTNYSISFTRNFIRHEVLPLIRSRFSGLDSNIERFGKIIQELMEHVRLVVENLYKECVVKKKKYICVSLNSFKKQSRLIQRQLVLKILSEIGKKNTPYLRLTDEILKLIDKKKISTITLPNNWLLCISGKEMIFKRSNFYEDSFKQTSFISKKISVPGRTILSNRDLLRGYTQGKGLQIVSEIVDKIPKRLDKKDTVFFDMEKVGKNLYLRFWQKSDYFYPLGLGGSKKLSDLFIDMKIPRPLREKVLLICSKKMKDSDIIYVMTEPVCRIKGRQDERSKIDNDTKKIIKLTFYNF